MSIHHFRRRVHIPSNRCFRRAICARLLIRVFREFVQETNTPLGSVRRTRSACTANHNGADGSFQWHSAQHVPPGKQHVYKQNRVYWPSDFVPQCRVWGSKCHCTQRYDVNGSRPCASPCPNALSSGRCSMLTRHTILCCPCRRKMLPISDTIIILLL